MASAFGLCRPTRIPRSTAHMERDIEAWTTIRSPADRARRLLLSDPGRVVHDHPVVGSAADSKELEGELVVEIADGSTLHQRVRIELGSPVDLGGVAFVPIAWHATPHRRLFPEFRGELRLIPAADDANLELAGRYRIPLGLPGRFGDSIAGRKIAQRSVSAFLEGCAQRIDREVSSRLAAVGWRPAEYPVSLRETRSENFIG